MRFPSTARTLVAALLLMPLLAACTDKVTGPTGLPAGVAGLYRLVSVDDQPLPADVGYALGFARNTEILAGRIDITTDGHFTDASDFRLWYPDESGYEEFTYGDQGVVYVSEDGRMLQLRPSGSPAYVLTRDGTALVQQWNGFVLRYEQDDPARQ